MYPATRTFYNGSNKPIVFKYQYDANNRLIRYGNDSLTTRDVSVHGINQTTYDLPQFVYFTSYAFKIAIQLDTSVDIYGGSPSQVSVDFVTNRFRIIQQPVAISLIITFPIKQRTLAERN